MAASTNKALAGMYPRPIENPLIKVKTASRNAASPNTTLRLRNAAHVPMAAIDTGTMSGAGPRSETSEKDRSPIGVNQIQPPMRRHHARLIADSSGASLFRHGIIYRTVSLSICQPKLRLRRAEASRHTVLLESTG